MNQSKRNSQCCRTCALSSSHAPNPTSGSEHSRKRSSSSVYDLTLLAPYTIFRSRHGFLYRSILRRTALSMSFCRAIFASPRSMFPKMRLYSLTSLNRCQNTSLYARTSSAVLPSISSAMPSGSWRPNFSHARQYAWKSRRFQLEKPPASFSSYSARSASVSGCGSVGFSAGSSCGMALFASSSACRARCQSYCLRATSLLYSAVTRGTS